MPVKFKIGDKVQLMYRRDLMYRLNAYKGKLDKGHIGRVSDVRQESVKVDGEGGGCWISKSQVSLAPEYPNPPHKHAELIKAWADGAEIEYMVVSSRDWIAVDKPVWALSDSYRIKPQKSEKELKLEELEAKAQALADEIKELRSNEK